MIEDFENVIIPDELVASEFQRIGIGGFVFYASLNETTTKTGSVTSNPVEDGSVLNDHIIKNPITISIEGELSDNFFELVNKEDTVQEIFPAVGIIQDYLPQRTQTQISKVNGLIATANDYLEQVNTALEKGAELYDFFTGRQADTTITAKFLEFFSQVYESKSIVDVECVDTIYPNMAITSFTVSKLRGEKNSYSFNISLQNIVIAETRVFNLVKNASGDAKAQGAALTNKGTQQTEEVTDQSFLSSVLGG